MDVTPIPNLKALRTKSLLTQKQLGDILGISPRTLIRWEAGQGDPGLSELLALAKYFGVSLGYLVGESSAESRPGTPPRVSDLSGVHLDYWVAKVRSLPVVHVDGDFVLYEAGVGHRPVPRFSADLSLAEPLMHSKGILLSSLPAGSVFEGTIKEAGGWVARCCGESLACWGSSIPEAGMRAWLSSEIGPHVLA